MVQHVSLYVVVKEVIHADSLIRLVMFVQKMAFVGRKMNV